MDLTINRAWPPGDEPTEIEVEALEKFGDAFQRTESVVVHLGEPAPLENDSPDVIRWRYIWDGVPGAWLGEGIVWQKPSPPSTPDRG